MSERLRSAVLLLLAMGSVALLAAAQNAAGPQDVTVVVVNALPQPPEPVKAARISLEYLDSGVTITDAQQVTNTEGQALLVVSGDAAQRSNLRLEITGARDLVLYEPADGQLPALPMTVRIRMLPKGSAALLGPAQIEAMLHRMSLQVANLQKKSSALQAEVNAGQQQKPDLGEAIAEWAQANGFSAAHADQQVQQWAEEIQMQSGQATAEQKALAELALKHYAEAARLFTQVSNADRQEIGDEDAEEQSLEAQVKALQAAQQGLLARQRSTLLQLIDHSQQAAGVEQLNLQFHQATQALESAAATAQAEYKKHPGDKGFHELWLRAEFDAASARWREAEVAPADQSLPLLAQASGEFQSVAGEYSALNDRPEAAAAENGLGIALMEEGERGSGDKARELLGQAVEAYNQALEVRTRADFPQDWAATENALGIALVVEGRHAAGNQAMQLFDQARETFGRTLEVRTQSDLPQDWARTEMDLGNTLVEEGERRTGEKAIVLLEQSVQAYKSSLEVFTKSDLPQYWGRTEICLGKALSDEAILASGDKANALFDQAAQAYRNALEVYTRAEMPQDWARVQVGLGVVLMSKGQRAGGEQAVSLLDQAVQAFQSALEVFAKTNLPQYWAATEDSLGNALAAEAQFASSDKSTALLEQGVQAFQKALEVRTKADLPQDWARTQMGLGSALTVEAGFASGDKTIALLDQAVQAYEYALEVFTKADLQQDWAYAESNLGSTLVVEGEYAGGDRATGLLDQAVQVLESVLEVYTKESRPQDWASTQLSIAEADFAAGRFDACVAQTARTTDDTLPASGVFSRDSMRLACEWGAGNKSAALATETALLAKAAGATGGFWDFTGIKHVLLRSPAFDKGRTSWIALFTAVQNGDSTGVRAALHQLEPFFQN